MTKLKRTKTEPTEKKEQIQQVSVATQHLFVELQRLIVTAKNKVNSQVNAALTQLYWQIGKQINNELLQQQRANYGQKIVKALIIFVKSLTPTTFVWHIELKRKWMFLFFSMLLVVVLRRQNQPTK